MDNFLKISLLPVLILFSTVVAGQESEKDWSIKMTEVAIADSTQSFNDIARQFFLMEKNAYEQALAFPGADGFGKDATGGRGGKVVYVTNLNNSGPGSLREAVEMEDPRIVVFSVSGNIDLKSPLKINDGDITIAGQSAPGDGICVRYYPVTVSADNVIIRYMRFRMGDTKKVQDDALSGRHIRNVIIDHCSISWGTDETATFYWVQDFTMQWCIISESLNNSVHEKGEHGYGGIWGGIRASFHHNLFAHHKSRTPRFSGSNSTSNSEEQITYFRNNVVYNWMTNDTYGGEDGRFNLVNSYYKPGPATEPSKRDRILNPYKPFGKFYVKGNMIKGAPEITQNNWDGGVQCEDGVCPDSIRQQQPFNYEMKYTESAEDAFEQVLARSGASLHRDAVDQRIVAEVRNGVATYEGSKTKKPGIIDSQKNVGGWPKLEAAPAPSDSDRDGIPDQWEEKHNLNSGNASDAAAYELDKNYTNIEVYLNSLVDSGKETNVSNE